MGWVRVRVRVGLGLGSVGSEGEGIMCNASTKEGNERHEIEEVPTCREWRTQRNPL